MADIIAKRTEHLVIYIQNKGQLSLLEQTEDDEMVSDEYLIERVKNEVDKFNKGTRLTEFLADFFNIYGVLCDSKRLKEILTELEKTGYIVVERDPFYTKTGKTSNSWSEKG